MAEKRETYDAGNVELERPDAATPAYALRELADWIEHRTATIAGKPASPADQSRIKLGREMADSLDEIHEIHSNTIVALHARIGELEQACAASFHSMREVLTVESVGGAETLIGVDADGPDQTGVANYQVPVAKTPTEPVEVHECSTLAFDHETHSGILKVRCDQGRCTDIELRELEQMVTKSQDVLDAIARRIASEHGLSLQELYSKMRGHSVGDLKAITMGTSSLPTPQKA